MALLFVLLSFFAADHAQARDYGDYHSDPYDSKQKSSSSANRLMGYLLMPSFTYVDINERNSVTGGTATNYERGLTLMDFKLGHTFRGGFYFGLMYSNESHGVSDLSLVNNRESFGVSAGYLKGGWSFVGTYFFQSRQLIEPETEAYIEYDEGSGFQIELGYHFYISKYIHVGPTVVYKDFRYSEAEDSAGTDAEADSRHSVITPMLSLIFVLHP